MLYYIHEKAISSFQLNEKAHDKTGAVRQTRFRHGW